MDLTKGVNWFEYDAEVFEYEVDVYDDFRLSNLQRVIQEAGSRHLNSWGYTFDELSTKFGMAYVLSGSSIKLNRAFKSGEKIRVFTGARRPVGVRNYRDFIIEDADENVVAEASTVWAAIDFKNHTLLKAEDIPITLHFMEQSQLSIPDAKKVRRNKAAQEIGKRVVRYTDIDYLGHLTNTRYTDIFYDYCNIDFENYEVCMFDITYQNETLEGDEMTLYGENKILDDGNIEGYMHGEATGELKFVAKAVFKKK